MSLARQLAASAALAALCSCPGSGAANDAGQRGDAAVPYVEPIEEIDLGELPAEVASVGIEIADEARARLEANPYTAADVTGVFIDSAGTRYQGIDLNFRGAYALRSLIESGSGRRNWKVKTSREQPYRGRREWNFNYEPHLRHKLAYDLMRFAGVKVPQPRHVLLSVNGVAQGLYLEYEDPDDKAWLTDKLGDDTGDLYKAATDLPGFPRYFATTEFLGEADSDYLQHYNKKLNNNQVPVSYRPLIDFLRGLNATAEQELEAWVDHNFDWRKFVSYLAVANFTSHWDGPPQRPKNFWLYQIPAAGRWLFIPWDLDSTFWVDTSGRDPMGTTASIWYQLDGHEPYEAEQGEGTERPLVRRLLRCARFREAYVASYRQALKTFLDKQYLLDRVDALEALLVAAASSEDRDAVVSSSAEMRQFIEARFGLVKAEIDGM